MNKAGAASAEQFRFLATFLAGRSLDVIETVKQEAAHTNGRTIFVSANSISEQRREVVLQSALLGAGSLDHRLVKTLRGRPQLARRYLALEGCRVLNELAAHVPLAAILCIRTQPTTTTADESLAVAKSKTIVSEPPRWFGAIRPSRLLASSGEKSSGRTNNKLCLDFSLTDMPDTPNSDEQDQAAVSKLLKLFESPLFNANTLANHFRKVFGLPRSAGEHEAGVDISSLQALRRVKKALANARPAPTSIHFTHKDTPGAVIGVGGARYPEWNTYSNQYRPKWCRVIDFSVTDADATDTVDPNIQFDEVLRKRLSELNLGLKICRRQSDGDDLDIGGLINLGIDLQTGQSPAENIYVRRRKLARNLSVLILLDASGSVSEFDSDGLCVHDHQRRAAATFAVTFEELGDRVALYACRSHGRDAVHLITIKRFEQSFSIGTRARLNQLQPKGYTRLGAAIRHAGEIIKAKAGTPHRLLLVLSDGIPYDEGYEAGYAEADTRKALEELRTDGIASVCLSIGTSTTTDALQRVFGAVSYAHAPKLADISPRMDEFFLAALKELSAPKQKRLVRFG